MRLLTVACLCALLSAVPAAADQYRRLPALGKDKRTPITIKRDSEADRQSYPIWACRAEYKLTHGVMSGVRAYTEDGKIDYGDFFHWNTLTSFPSKWDRPIDWEVSYIWSVRETEPFDDRRAELRARIGLDVDVPDAGLLTIQRPFPIEPNGIIGSTALTTTIFRYSGGDTKGAHGEIPLGDLLAYAGNHDSLDWTITTFHDQYGHAKPLAEGKVNIAALREAAAAIPRMKAELVAKAENFRANCPRETALNMPIMY